MPYSSLKLLEGQDKRLVRRMIVIIAAVIALAGAMSSCALAVRDYADESFGPTDEIRFDFNVA